MNPWHAECKECRAWLVPPRSELCPRCEEKVNAYANAMIKRDKVQGYTYHPSMDMDTAGMPLHGRGSREAIHKAHFTARDDKDE